MTTEHPYQQGASEQDASSSTSYNGWLSQILPPANKNKKEIHAELSRTSSS